MSRPESDGDKARSFDAIRRDAVQRLENAGIETPDADARILLARAASLDDAQLIARRADLADRELCARFEAMLMRRLAREPVARILGSREFWSLEFSLSPETLVPRPDTETVVEAALQLFPQRDAAIRIADLGTGSGAILAALLRERPFASGVAVDVSEAALRVAHRNFERLGVGARAACLCANWLDGISARFDLIVSNPPYIATRELALLSPEVRENDPRLALDGGADGLDAYRAIVPALERGLVESGYAVLELGQGQEPAIGRLVEMFPALETSGKARADLAGIGRAFVIRRRQVRQKTAWNEGRSALG
jgi:release factor glutamine methyltransferase